MLMSSILLTICPSSPLSCIWGRMAVERHWAKRRIYLCDLVLINSQGPEDLQQPHKNKKQIN